MLHLSQIAKNSQGKALLKLAKPPVRLSQVSITAAKKTTTDLPKPEDFETHGEFVTAWNRHVPPLCRR